MFGSCVPGQIREVDSVPDLDQGRDMTMYPYESLLPSCEDTEEIHQSFYMLYYLFFFPRCSSSICHILSGASKREETLHELLSAVADNGKAPLWSTA